MKLDKILEMFPDEYILSSDGFDEAIIGVEESSFRLIYSVSKCVDILSKDMTKKEALEFFSFNVSGAYVGKKTPIWSWDLPFEEIVTDNSKVNYNLIEENKVLKEKILTKEDKDVLQFIYERMECFHEENVNYDYMIAFKKILDKL